MDKFTHRRFQFSDGDVSIWNWLVRCALWRYRYSAGKQASELELKRDCKIEENVSHEVEPKNIMYFDSNCQHQLNAYSQFTWKWRIMMNSIKVASNFAPGWAYVCIACKWSTSNRSGENKKGESNKMIEALGFVVFEFEKEDEKINDEWYGVKEKRHKSMNSKIKVGFVLAWEK